MVWKFITNTLTQDCRFSINPLPGNCLWPIALFVLIGFFTGCATTTSITPRDSNDLEEVSLSDNEALEAIFSSTPTKSAIDISEHPETEAIIAPLTLDEVIAIAFENNPTFAEFAGNRELARSQVLEAMAWQNPEFDSGLRYVHGGSDDVEYELGLSQTFELPSKRRVRREAAEAMELVVEREEASFKVLLRAEVTKAYRTVAYREAKIALETQNMELAEEIVTIVERQVDAGSGRPVEVTRAKVEVLKTKKQIQIEQRLRHISRKLLNSLCGQGLPQKFELTNSLPAQFEPANTKQVLAQAQIRHPELRRLLALQQKKELELNREQVAWYPDFSPGVGFEQEDDADNYIFSFGLEIPLWNKNQGGIAKAKAELQQIDAKIQRINQDIIRDAEVALEAYAGALEQIRAFEELRSAAADTLKMETFLYEQGEVDFITLLDARRTVQETESEYLAALYDAHLSRTELEQIIGITGVH